MNEPRTLLISFSLTSLILVESCRTQARQCLTSLPEPKPCCNFSAQKIYRSGRPTVAAGDMRLWWRTRAGIGAGDGHSACRRTVQCSEPQQEPRSRTPGRPRVRTDPRSSTA
ncbi:hypothetical protein CRG98_005060 [Punica granatum]|uniref:Secreted protein n=1 Tax=Punica granatum TaxID=22663 RepID=A0A2I0L274_PUNGR|nr:hypothetical protein CRG98_005060 [Punica granatum]